MAEPSSSPVHWRGHQWAVTDYGVELVGRGFYAYDIAHDVLSKPLGPHGKTWREHLLEKRWFDVADFDRAVIEAQKLGRC